MHIFYTFLYSPLYIYISSIPFIPFIPFTSFIFATMRRNLLCCRPGAFVQWMAWYNLTRSSRDQPMLDRPFMHALGKTYATMRE